MCVAPTSRAASTSFFAMSGRAEGRKERVLPAVERVRLYRRGDVLFSEFGPRVSHEGVCGAYLERLRLHVFRGLPLAEIQVQRIRLCSLLLEPLDADRGVKAARVGEHDFLSFQHDSS